MGRLRNDPLFGGVIPVLLHKLQKWVFKAKFRDSAWE